MTKSGTRVVFILRDGWYPSRRTLRIIPTLEFSLDDSTRGNEKNGTRGRFSVRGVRIPFPNNNKFNRQAITQEFRVILNR